MVQVGQRRTTARTFGTQERLNRLHPNAMVRPHLPELQQSLIEQLPHLRARHPKQHRRLVRGDLGITAREKHLLATHTRIDHTSHQLGGLPRQRHAHLVARNCQSTMQRLGITVQRLHHSPLHLL